MLVDIVFDGPPGPEAGRFVEVEDMGGNSVAVGQWVQRDDGLWALRIHAMTSFRHTLDMGEISGFGGTYEDGCQIMLDAGVKWLNDHPDADLKAHTFENVTGILIEDSDDAKVLSEVIVAAADEAHPDGGVTGAMHQAVMSRLIVIQERGWDWYCEEARKAEEEHCDDS